MRHIIRLNGQGGPEGREESEEERGESERLSHGRAEAYRPQLDGLRARIQSHNCGETKENRSKNALLLTPRPFVTLSYAQSLDGCLTAQQGTATPISAPASLTMTHALRAAHSTILVGIETVLADDPALTVRLVAGDSPQPVIVDSHLRTPPDARLLRGRGAPWIATTGQGAQSSRRRRLEEAGARILTLPADEEGRVGLAALLASLGAEGIGSLMVEGGARILTSFLEGGLADYAVITIAPVFLGGYQMIQPAGAGDELRAIMPRLQNIEQVQLATDTVLWGEFEKRVARNGRSAA